MCTSALSAVQIPSPDVHISKQAVTLYFLIIQPKAKQQQIRGNTRIVWTIYNLGRDFVLADLRPITTLYSLDCIAHCQVVANTCKEFSPERFFFSSPPVCLSVCAHSISIDFYFVVYNFCGQFEVAFFRCFRFSGE